MLQFTTYKHFFSQLIGILIVAFILYYFKVNIGDDPVSFKMCLIMAFLLQCITVLEEIIVGIFWRIENRNYKKVIPTSPGTPSAPYYPHPSSVESDTKE